MFETLPNSSEELCTQMLAECITALKVNTFMDNYDHARFDMDGIDKSTQFYGVERANWFRWFVNHYERIFEATSLLGDDQSKRLYLAIIAFRLAGHHSVKIPVDFDWNGQGHKDYKESMKSDESSLNIVGIFGNLKRYDFEMNHQQHVIDCIDVESYVYRKQYFYSKDGVDISPAEGDHVIDGGACLGDTAVIFGHAVGDSGRVYAFDPVLDHLEALAFNIKQNPGIHVQSMPYGLSDVDVDCDPLKLNKYAPGFSSGGHEVPLRSIDTLVAQGDIPKIDYIKLDVEGSELQTLSGALGSIRKFKPKLAVSLYHKPNDIFDIPLFIHQNFPGYRMHIGHYTIHHEETVLYCIQ